MVLSLHKIRTLEDHKLLAGYVAMFLGEFDAAQAAFMESSLPLAALEVCACCLTVLCRGSSHGLGVRAFV